MAAGLAAASIATVNAAASNTSPSWRTTAWATATIRQSHSSRSDVHCSGLAPGSSGLYLHFRCNYSAYGDQFKEIVSGDGSETWVDLVRSPDRLLGLKSSSGEFPTAISSGTAHKIGLMFVRIRVHPDQPVDVDWTVSCSQGSKAAGRSGHFVGYDYGDREMKLPYDSFYGEIDCSFAAGGSIEKSGTVTIEVVGV